EGIETHRNRPVADRARSLPKRVSCGAMGEIPLGVLTGMITPAVLISACGTLIFSTSTRLARIVDRVRQLTAAMEDLFADEPGDFPHAHREEAELPLSIPARPAPLIQWSLTRIFVWLG